MPTHPPAEPLAVIDGPLQRRHVVLADACAQNRQCSCGQPLTAARALCPRLSTTPRDPGAERQALESIAAFAYRFSAESASASPMRCFSRSARAWRSSAGSRRCERRLCLEIAAFGFASTLADRADCGRCARACRACRRHGDTFAAGVRTRRSGWCRLRSRSRRDITAALHGMGFRLLARSVPPAARRARAPHRAGRARSARSHARHRRRIAAALSAAGFFRASPRVPVRHRIARRARISVAALDPRASRRSSSRATAACSVFRSCSATNAARRHGSKSACSHRGAMRRRCSSLRAHASNASRCLRPCTRSRCAPTICRRCVRCIAIFSTLAVPRSSTGRRSIERLRARLGDRRCAGLRCVADHRPARAWRVHDVEMPRRSIRHRRPQRRPSCRAATLGCRSARSGCCRDPMHVARRTRRGSWPAPSASKAAGGTITTNAATIT